MGSSCHCMAADLPVETTPPSNSPSLNISGPSAPLAFKAALQGSSTGRPTACRGARHQSSCTMVVKTFMTFLPGSRERCVCSIQHVVETHSKSESCP